VDLGPHAGFILAAYFLTAAIVGTLVLWAFVDHRTQRRALASLETRGVARRSDEASSSARTRSRTQAPRGH
jgi:heme exporter protein D